MDIWPVFHAQVFAQAIPFYRDLPATRLCTHSDCGDRPYQPKTWILDGPNLSPELSGKIGEFIAMMPDIDDDPCGDPPRISINPATMHYQYA